MSSHDICVRCDTPLKDGKAKCHGCGLWNIVPGGNRNDYIDDSVTLDKVVSADHTRLKINKAVDYCWGATLKNNKPVALGMVITSASLIGGVPGAGKSTMLLQLSNAVAKKTNKEAIYIAAEEALEEVKQRADRLNLSELYRIRMVPAMNGANVAKVLQRHNEPSIVIIDSLQGLVGDEPELQLEVCKIGKLYAVQLRAPVIIISHVTKDDVIAGRMTLQHAVDTTMTFFPEENKEDYRTLHVLKNRFGRAHIGYVFEMTAEGLIPVCEEEKLTEDDETEED